MKTWYRSTQRACNISQVANLEPLLVPGFCSSFRISSFSQNALVCAPSGASIQSVAKKRYQAVGFPCNRMLKLSSSRGIRIDVPVLSVSWSSEDHSVIIQALRKGLYRARGQGYWRSPSLEVLLSRSSGRGYKLNLRVMIFWPRRSRPRRRRGPFYTLVVTYLPRMRISR